MPAVGDRIELLPSKVGQVPRPGVVTAITGVLITVRWDTGEETKFVPGPGVLSVVGGGRRRTPARPTRPRAARTTASAPARQTAKSPTRIRSRAAAAPTARKGTTTKKAAGATKKAAKTPSRSKQPKAKGDKGKSKGKNGKK